MNESLPDQLAKRFGRRRPSWQAARRFAPELSYGELLGMLDGLLLL
jgi:hypothetical protein